MLIRGVNNQSEGGRYLIACARIRNITPVELVRELLDVIGRDQLVLAILDDDGHAPRAKHQHRFREPDGPPVL